MENRRRSRRAFPARDVLVKVAGRHPARVVDITAKGARLEMEAALRPLAECRISLPLEDGIVRVKATIVHCKLVGMNGGLTYRAGVEFQDVDRKLADAIERSFPAPVFDIRTTAAVDGPPAGDVFGSQHGPH